MERPLSRAAGFLRELVLPVDRGGCGRTGPARCGDCRARLIPRVISRRTAGGTVVAAATVASTPHR